MLERFKRFFPQFNVYCIISGITGFISLMVFSFIAPTRLSHANFGIDSGDFLAAFLTQGIPHPTGYPTYTLLGILFQQIPAGTPVFRGVLASLIPAAVATGLLAAWVRYVLGGNSKSHVLAALSAGVAWGVSPLLFSQAVIVDVHGLQSLIAVLVLWWITLNLEGKYLSQPKALMFLSFLMGLGCGNHATIIFLAPVGFTSLVLALKRGSSWKFVFTEIGLILIGLCVYLYLPIRASAYPPINWGNPQTLAGFLWEVTGNPYRGLLFSIPTTVLWDRVSSLARLFLDQFGAIGFIAGVVGFVQFPLRDRWLRGILIWIFIVTIVFATGYNTGDSVGYLIPAVLVFAIWIGLAIPSLWIIRWNVIPVGIGLSLVLFASIILRTPDTISRLDARDQDQPARYAEQYLSEAPQNAILFTSVTEDTFPLWYYHFGLHYRPDVRIIVLPLTQFVWYQEVLVHVYPDLIFPPFSEHEHPNADWGLAVKSLNLYRPVCTSRLSAENELGVSYTCNTP